MQEAVADSALERVVEVVPEKENEEFFEPNVRGGHNNVVTFVATQSMHCSSHHFRFVAIALSSPLLASPNISNVLLFIILPLTSVDLVSLGLVLIVNYLYVPSLT